ncbi:MAG: hypothetical protein FJW66_06435 [Actinobacteria bacterium]|nr:hypothetical protein [Actinomycetota bacterium]
MEEKIKGILGRILSGSGHSFTDSVSLPEKFTTVVCGLGKYGKNNLCYVDGMGSFNTPIIYLSDLAVKNDQSSEQELPNGNDMGIETDLMAGKEFAEKNYQLKTCMHCAKCRDNCPTAAIIDDSFVINPENCITYFNENEFEIPGWILSEWQNTLVGCMRCQDICPANKKVLKNTVKGPAFQQPETDAILKNTEFESLPESAKSKIHKLCMEGYYPILSRNLNMLLNIN